MPERQPIPNINIGQVYDQRYADAEVHYDALGNLAGFFGRNMPAHRHDRFFQVHYVKNGAVRVYLDERQYLESGPMFFLTPPTVPHAFVTEADADGHVLTVRQQLVWSLTEAEPGLAPGPQVRRPAWRWATWRAARPRRRRAWRCSSSSCAASRWPAAPAASRRCWR